MRVDLFDIDCDFYLAGPHGFVATLQAQLRAARRGAGADRQRGVVIDDAAVASCAGGESFALMVLGHSMAPEFNEGEIIIIEPEGLARDGSYVLAWHGEEWTFRQLLGGPGTGGCMR